MDTSCGEFSGWRDPQEENDSFLDSMEPELPDTTPPKEFDQPTDNMLLYLDDEGERTMSRKYTKNYMGLIDTSLRK